MTSHFNRGWSDRLNGIAPPETYHIGRRWRGKSNTLARVQYERGRHAAALWEFYLNASGSTITAFGSVARTTYARKWPCKLAWAWMPDDLREALRAEERFCSLQCEALASRIYE